MLRYRIAIKLIAPGIKVRKSVPESIVYDSKTQSMVIGKYFDPNDYGFMRHLSQAHEFPEGLRYSYNLWHILHELGHYFTEEKYGDNIGLRQWFKENGKLMIRNVNLQNSYYNYREEWEATEWAIDWVKKHKKKAVILNLLVR